MAYREHTQNAQRVYKWLADADVITFALFVGEFAHQLANEGGDFSHTVEKWWRWTEEMAVWAEIEGTWESLTDTFTKVEHCEECYESTDLYSEELEHYSDCSKA